MVSFYINNLKDEHNKMITKTNKDGTRIVDEKDVDYKLSEESYPYTKLTFSAFKSLWENFNPDLAVKLEDNTYAKLGGKIIYILEHSEMVTR